MSARSIILVEDDPALRTLTARALAAYGYDVRTATTGAELWVLLDNGPADLIVLDIMLPGIQIVMAQPISGRIGDGLLWNSPVARAWRIAAGDPDRS